jgi:pimeloyl-ACP methyl ester carboxylesterase
VSGFERAVAPHATPDAPAAPGGPWPVVLFSPGWDGVCQAYTALAEDLASHGWVVAGVNHPYFASVVTLPSGRTVRHLDLPPGGPTAFFEHHLPTLVADMRLLLDSLEGPNREPVARPWSARLDLRRVAAMGHSLGGAVAAELARTDPRVCVAVDLDGTLLGDAARVGVDKPVLWVLHDGGEPDLLGELPAWREAVAGSLAAEVSGSGHRSSEDLPTLLGPLVPPDAFADLGWGTSDPRQTLDTIRATVSEFVDVRLRGGPEPGLRRLPALYPGLRLIAPCAPR